MKNGIAGIVALFVVLVAVVIGYSSLFTVSETQQVLLVRLGEPVRVVTAPGLNFKVPFIDTVISIDKRIHLERVGVLGELLGRTARHVAHRCDRSLNLRDCGSLLERAVYRQKIGP